MAKKVELKPTHSLSEFTLETGYMSKDIAAIEEFDLSTEIVQSFKLKIPFLSAAMQAVTNDVLAAELARCGGLGVIYCSQPVESQAEMVGKVKEAGIDNPKNYRSPLKPLVDREGRLRVGAAINTYDYKDRVPTLVKAGADIIFIDSSHGNTEFQKETLEYLVEKYHHIPRVGGNVINEEGFRNLAEWGAEGIKIGMGIGSMCITTNVKATGKGQATAIMEVVAARDQYERETHRYIPIIADGGIKSSRDMCIALALDANALMMGHYFARLEESAKRKSSRAEFLKKFPHMERQLDPTIKFLKEYWGEGSKRAKEFAKYRYDQVPFEEGVDGYVEYAGSLRENVRETLMKIIKSMKDTGSSNLAEFRRNAVVRLASPVALAEAAVHGLVFYNKTNLT